MGFFRGPITDWDSGTWLRLRGCKGLGTAIPFNPRVDKIEPGIAPGFTIQYNTKIFYMQNKADRTFLALW